MSALLHDLRHAWQQLRRSPGFAVPALLILGLGIGSVTTMFSVVDGVLLKPFAFRNASRLVIIQETFGHKKAVYPDNYQHYLNWQTHSRTLDNSAIFVSGSFSIARGTGHPQVVNGLRVSPNFFSVLGIQPILGRSFLTSEASRGHSNVVILSWSAWQKYFHGSSEAAGETLNIGGVPQTVVGVLPRGFTFPRIGGSVISRSTAGSYRIFKPLLPDPSIFGDHNYLVIARLHSGVTLAQAQSEIGALQKGYFRANGAPNASSVGVSIEPLINAVTSRMSVVLWLLLAAAGAVLLVGCLNLASLQLARAVAHEKEIAIRVAMGASRRQIVWAILRENFILAVIGGTFGVLVAIFTMHLVVAKAPITLPRLNALRVNWVVLSVGIGLSLGSALLFGLLPVMRSLRIDPHSVLQANTQRAANSRAGLRARNILVAGEVACTVGLLILGGLLLRSLSTILTQRRDFTASHLILTQVDLDTKYYNTGKIRADFMDKALSRLARIPGVQAVALSTTMPMTGDGWQDAISRPDNPLPMGQQPIASIRWVSPSYRNTLRIPLIKGRDLSNFDRDNPRNVLISQNAAHEIWPGGDPVGETFNAGGETYTVVGIVANTRLNNLKYTTPLVFIPFWDNPIHNITFLIRSPLPTSTLADSIRQAIWKVDPEVSIPALKSMTAQINDSLAAEQLQGWLLSSFAIVALMLAFLGIYGTLAYSVSLRTREFGIRMALGCNRGTLALLVLRRGSLPVITGIVAGLGIGLVATRWVQSLLYHVSPVDPAVVAICIGIVLCAALLATLVPAHRAASVDPMRALRAE